MFRYTEIAIVMGLVVIFPLSVQAITCDRCLEIDKEKMQVRQELTENGKSLKEAFQRQEYAKVKTLRNRINSLRKKLIELRKTDMECRDACQPEEMKKGECEKIKREIVSMDIDGELSESRLKKIDKLYENLLKCNEEWRRMVGDSE